MEFKSVQELRAYLNKEHQGSRVKFATKVFHVLNFTKKHPEAINICGAAWCADEYHFICNATIIAAFLELRSNSINTNFRDHGFKIDHTNVSQISHEFPFLHMVRNWKKRSNTSFPFTSRLTVQDIEKIPCNSARPSAEVDKSTSSSQETPKQQNNVSDLPPSVLMIIQADAISYMHTSLIYREISQNRSLLMEAATQEWSTIFGLQPFILKQSFITQVASKIGDQNDIPQLTTNALFLMRKNQDYDMKISFHEYLNFILHYGFLENCIDMIIQLSAKSITTTNVPHFHEWFQPYFNRDSSMRILSGIEDRDCWFVSPSEKPLKFDLFYKCQNEISVTEIIFNPLDADEKFSVCFENQIMSAPNWGTLLYSILKLDSTERLEAPPILSPVISLNATELTKRCQKPLKASSQPTACDYSLKSLLLPLSRRPGQVYSQRELPSLV